MSKITKISAQEKNKNRCNIFIDGDFFMGIPLELVYSNSLKVGMDIDKEKLKEIAKEKDYLDALNKATNYISKNIKTKKQLNTYLLGKGFDKEAVDRVIEKLIEYNYVNDKDYAKRYIESTSSYQGVNLVKYKLMMKGLRKEVVENLYEELDVNSQDNAYRIAIKHIKDKERTKENLSKTYRYLISKGFTYDDANYAIDRLKEN